MGARTQADLRLQGIGSEKIPHSLLMIQAMNQHSYVKTVVWLTGEEASESERYVASGAYVILTTSEDNAKPLFCGIIIGSRVFRKEGRFAAELELRSYTWLMDQNPKKVSFQQSGRTCQKLTELLLAPYHGIYTWDQPGKERVTDSFLMQYEETDWEFLCRMAAKQSYPVFSEDRGTAVEVCIGLPQDHEVSELETDQYRIRSRMHGAWREPDQPGCLVPSVEYLIEGVEEEIPFGDPVVFLQRHLWVVERNCYLKAGVLLYDYVLRAGESCRVEPWQNGALSGAAVCGTVTATSAAKSKLSLVTDTAGEAADAWHVQGLYYTGGGAGYSGSPEKGDTQYLYFPTSEETDRYVIGGAGTDYANIEQTTASIMSGLEEEKATAQKGTVTAAARQTALGGGSPANGKAAGTSGGKGSVMPETVPAVKSWTTPGRQSLSLSGEGIRLAAGSGISLSLSDAGIAVQGKGDMVLDAEQIRAGGKHIRMNAKTYILLKCNSNQIAMVPGAIHIKGYRILLQDNVERRIEVLNERNSMRSVEAVMKAYERRKKRFAQYFASDGSAIRRDTHEEFFRGTEMYDYFDKYVYGIDENYPRTSLEITGYDVWIKETYGLTTTQKIAKAVFSLDTLQAALDVAGFVLPPADLVNAVISLARGNYVAAGIDAISAIPWLGDQIKASDMASAVGKKIKGLEFTYKVTGSVDVLTSGLKGTVDALDGAIDIQKGMDAADTVLGVGRTTEAFGDLADAAGNARNVGKVLDGAASAGKVLDGSGAMKYFDDVAGPGVKAVDNYANGGKIADSIGDAASGANKALKGADGLKAADTAKYWDDAMDQAAGAERYVYRGKDVSPDLTVGTKVVDDAGNIIDTYKGMGDGVFMKKPLNPDSYLGTFDPEFAALSGSKKVDLAFQKIEEAFGKDYADQIRALYESTNKSFFESTNDLGLFNHNLRGKPIIELNKNIGNAELMANTILHETRHYRQYLKLNVSVKEWRALEIAYLERFATASNLSTGKRLGLSSEDLQIFIDYYNHWRGIK